MLYPTELRARGAGERPSADLGRNGAAKQADGGDGVVGERGLVDGANQGDLLAREWVVPILEWSSTPAVGAPDR
ncbi:MAG: hypothetical protein IIB57_08935 [Planctomycetes bacterium]|nr:hypothetical protein [Planctomycetota bacterium]